MKFIIGGGEPAKVVTLEQAADDVIVRVNNLAVVALRSQEGVVAIESQSVTELGLTSRTE